MTFTFQNVWENRYAFIDACKKNRVYTKGFEESKTEKEFLDELHYRNFNDVNFAIDNFIPKFEIARCFFEDTCEVMNGDKWGYINKDGSILFDTIFGSTEPFVNNSAKVALNGRLFRMDKEGNAKELPCLSISEMKAIERRRMPAPEIKYFKIDKHGNLTEIK